MCFVQIVVCILVLLTFSMKWCMKYFGNISMNEIMFTLNMPLKGASNEYYTTYLIEALTPSIIVCILFVFSYTVLSRLFFKFDVYLKFSFVRSKGRLYINNLFSKRIIGWAMLAFWFMVIIYIANKNYKIWDYIKNTVEASEFIENEYVSVDDIDIRFPKDKKNLICIFVESAETTFQDRENGGVFDTNIIPEMTEIAKEHISFSQSENIEGAAIAPGTGWTIAALVAQTSGIPLKLYSYGVGTKGPDNAMGKYEFFLPGAVSLGELLEQNGYHNFFMAGSDFSFAGRTEYFTQHGNYEIWDYFSAGEEGKIADDYIVKWGFEDLKLYEFAKEKLLDLAKDDQPFNFSMLTVDTHTGGGYVCERCPNIFENSYANVWACASRQLADFLNWLKQQDFYDNTVICIAGDHSSMQGDFVEDYTYDKHNGDTDRKVYNVFINSQIKPIKMKNRKFTTLDFCPSILAALGVNIEGERMGLGTNLFSDRQTLPEEYGYETMFEELGKKSVFYNKEILYP